MFQVVKKEAFNKSIRMPNELIIKLERLALEKDVSFNSVVVQCCEYAIQHIKG